MTEDELVEIAGRAELADGDVKNLLHEIRALRREGMRLNTALSNVCRELAIHQLACDPMAVAKARKECSMTLPEPPSGEIERQCRTL